MQSSRTRALSGLGQAPPQEEKSCISAFILGALAATFLVKVKIEDTSWNAIQKAGRTPPLDEQMRKELEGKNV